MTDAGPFGDTTRFTPINPKLDPVNGVSSEEYLAGRMFERPISISWTAYSTVSQARAALPNEIGAVTWVAQNAPHHGSYLPVYAGVDHVPQSLLAGTPCKRAPVAIHTSLPLTFMTLQIITITPPTFGLTAS
jgi:dipeptidase